MGTVFSIDIRDTGDWDPAIAEIVAWLHHVDAVFSTYKPSSDISRIQRRELRLADADPDVTRVLDLCADAQDATGGAFTAIHNGELDPTGLVKGWAVEQASHILRRHGARNHAINGGGDMQLSGTAAPDQPWAVGIADPQDRSRVLSVIQGRDLAVATSGIAERGAHIVDPFTGTPVTAVASATVIGPSLTLADAFATAAVVRGPRAAQWIDEQAGYAALIVTATGSQHRTTGWPT